MRAGIPVLYRIFTFNYTLFLPILYGYSQHFVVHRFASFYKMCSKIVPEFLSSLPALFVSPFNAGSNRQIHKTSGATTK